MMSIVPFPTKEEIEKINLFFIIGRPRSGTTLLRTLLDAHQNVVVPTECPFIIHLAKRYKKVTRWNFKTIDRFIEDLKKIWLFPVTGIDLNLLKNNLYSLSGSADYLTICKAIILTFPKVFEKKEILFLGDKNPGYSINLRYLYRLTGANAKYILIVRDYRDQFLSVNKTYYDFPNIVIPTKRWKESIKKFRMISKKRPELFHTLRYEDLVTSPEMELKKITDFLGIIYDPQVLKFHEHKEEFLKIFSEQALNGIHKSLLNPINTDKIGLWKKELKPVQIKMADTVAGKYADQFFYERVSKKTNIYFFLRTIPGIIVYYLIRFSVLITRFMPFHLYIMLSKHSLLAYLWNKLIRK